MTNVDVDPGTLRAAGENLTDARERLVDDVGLVPDRLGGYGEHTRVSTGGFEMGEQCQMRMDGHRRLAAEVYRTIGQNLMALASSLHIVADVYDTADHEEAVKFAFAMPGVDVPAGLPPYIDPEKSFNDWTAQDRAGAEEAVQGDAEVASGGATQHTYTRRFHPGLDTEPLPTDEVTEHYDADGNLLKSEHHLSYPDGSDRYYTSHYDGAGDVERTDGEWEFGPQPAPADGPMEAGVRAMDESQEMVEDQLEGVR
jgi:hypothetical protein